MKLSKEVLKRRVFNLKVNDKLKQTTILRELDPYVSGVCVDVGAATGHITHYLAPLAEHVWAFEPVEPVHRQLRKMELVHDNVTAVQAAVADFNGEATIYVDDKRLSNSGFQNLVDGPSTTVQTWALDTFFDERTEIGFVKIDVEGTELDVIKGARRILLENSPHLLVEIYEPYSKYPIDWIFDHLFALGYGCFYYQHPEGLIAVRDTRDGVEAVQTKHKVHDGDFLFAWPSDRDAA